VMKVSAKDFVAIGITSLLIIAVVFGL